MTGREVDAEGLDQGLDDPFELLTADEVARWLRMTPAWVYAQTRANNIPYVPLGRYVRYRRSAVKAWMAGDRTRLGCQHVHPRAKKEAVE